MLSPCAMLLCLPPRLLSPRLRLLALTVLVGQQHKAMKCAPRLRTGIGRVQPRLWGRRSRYGQDFDIPVAPGDFFSYFRFAREDIPDLMAALRIPTKLMLRDDGGNYYIDGEEALLIFLRRLASPCRLVDLQFFFNRSPAALSQIIDRVLKHLDVIARRKLSKMDFDYWAPQFDNFAAAVAKKRGPLKACIGFVDGVFRAMCRPGRDGQRGLRQRAFYSGYKKAHGVEFQGEFQR